MNPMHPIPDERVFCVTGLGNPGRKYAETRHNIGFKVIYRLAGILSPGKPVFFVNHYEQSAVRDNARIVLCKPWTYMNRSGEAVSLTLRELNIDAGRLLVVYDDAALPLGVLRIRSRGSDGGHNGMASTISELGTEHFARVRCGIGSAPAEADLADHVLDAFAPEEAGAADEMAARAADAILHCIDFGIESAMTQFNAKRAI
jgi:peptidyl-tRNA hydrolase, PTH1 family